MKELQVNELAMVNGGVDWDKVAIGIGAVGLSIAIIGTAGLATVPITLIGAATAGEVMLIGVSATFALGGGAAIGTGLTE